MQKAQGWAGLPIICGTSSERVHLGESPGNAVWDYGTSQPHGGRCCLLRSPVGQEHTTESYYSTDQRHDDGDDPHELCHLHFPFAGSANAERLGPWLDVESNAHLAKRQFAITSTGHPSTLDGKPVAGLDPVVVALCLRPIERRQAWQAFMVRTM